ncbi:MAG: polysaccharide biosynthesis C-terminal domain-containing protein [Thalassovita sp.]
MSVSLASKARAALSTISDPATLLANLGSVAALAIAGVVLNLTVGRVYGFEGLGVFSQALIFFLILGQIAAGGFAFAALYHFSRRGAYAAEGRAYLLATCIPVAAVGAVLALILWQGAGMIGDVLGSAPLAACLPAVGLAVFLFGLNKIGINALNGMSHLKTYALLQGLRMPLMLAAFTALAMGGADAGQFGWIFVASEAVILVLLIGFLWRYTPSVAVSAIEVAALMRETSGRGWRGALIGLLADVNSKVDVLILGLLVSDTVVGIYALGAMFADGLRMVLAAIQSIVNPRIATYIADSDRTAFDALWSTLARMGRAIAALITLIAALFMIYLVPSILGADDIATSTLVFVIIALSSTLAAPAVILNQAFTQGSAPGLQTKFLAVLAGVNLLLNLALIPFFGPVGAAVATAIAEGMQLVLLLRWLPRVLR